MHEYRRVGPTFWNGRTGRALKKQGSEAVIVAMYLMTCQHSNMLGLYFLSKEYIAADTGLGMEGASKGLLGAIEAGFCHFDEESEMVWVVEMAAYQVGEQLQVKDLRCTGIQREYNSLQENPFLHRFFERYSAAFHMTGPRGEPKPLASTLPSPLVAPTKPGAGTEEGAEEGAGAVLGAASSPTPAPSPTPPAAEAASKRGTRLSREWILPKAWGQRAQAKYPHWSDEVVRAIAGKFRNYWVAKSGKDATKVDWEATWENWCDSSITQGEHPPSAPTNTLDSSLAKAERLRAAMRATGGAAAPAAPLEYTDG